MVLIMDQSSQEAFDRIRGLCIHRPMSMQWNRIDSLYSGYGIDYAIRNRPIQTDYICQLHADAFPISDQWLRAAIVLMEENKLAFSGVLQFICDSPSPIYPYKGKSVFGMAQCFNIGRTDVYKEMSMQGGFTRFHNRLTTGMTWESTEWNDWSKEDYDHRGSDDDVPAFFWEDNNREHDKLGFGFTGKMGIDGKESNYGTIIEDLVFHFGFHRESRGVMGQMGENYRNWTRRIHEGYTDELIQEMLSVARTQPTDPANNRLFWDGTKKIATRTSHTINQRIEQLKNGLD